MVEYGKNRRSGGHGRGAKRLLNRQRVVQVPGIPHIHEQMNAGEPFAVLLDEEVVIVVDHRGVSVTNTPRGAINRLRREGWKYIQIGANIRVHVFSVPVLSSCIPERHPIRGSTRT